MLQTESDRAAVHQRSVLLVTGVTGFLGKRLLAELLSQTTATLVCLVRATDELEAQRRGSTITKDLRVVFIAADLEQRRLGLSEQAWNRLAKRVTQIYHCAASVSFSLPLEASRRINVAGTKSLLDLATAATQHGQFHRFHHVSTAYVAGRKRGMVNAHYLPDYRDSRKFRNSYEQSKAEAEHLLRSQARVPVSIYRPSIIAGDTRYGATDNFNVLYVPMRLIHRGAMPLFPVGWDGLVDCVGIDYVVRGIIALGNVSYGRCDSFHLTAGTTSFRTQDLVKITNEESKRAQNSEAAKCEVVSDWRWNGLRFGSAITQLAPQRFKRLRLKGELFARGMQKIAPYAPYSRVQTIFDCTPESALLAAADIKRPLPLDYLRTIVKYAIQVDFGLPD